MKLTWKNQNKNKNKKRPLSSISLYPNLPFDQNDDHNHPTTEDRPGTDDDTELKAEQAENDSAHKTLASDDDETAKLAEAFQAQGNELAEDGRYHEALGKWEAALTLMPERAVLHEQKAQVLLEIGEAWNGLKAATRESLFFIFYRTTDCIIMLNGAVICGATELVPSWAEAWITLGRAQLNFGEPDSAIESFDRALAIKHDSVEARNDRQTALHLLKKRKQLHSSGLNTTENRYVVGDKTESS